MKKKIKKIWHTVFCITLFWVALSAAPYLSAEDGAYKNSKEDMSVDYLFLDDSMHLLETTDFPASKTTTPASALELLIGVGLIDALRYPLYLRTNPLKTISLLDIDNFSLHLFD